MKNDINFIHYMTTSVNEQDELAPEVLLGVWFANRAGKMVLSCLLEIKRCIPLFPYYYTALSHNDCELPNSRIWWTEMYIDRSL